MLLCPGWGLISIGWDVVCRMESRICSVPLTVLYSGSDLQLWAQQRGAGPVCDSCWPACVCEHHRSKNIPPELPVHRAQTTFFFLPFLHLIPLPLSHHFSQLFLLSCYLWRLRITATTFILYTQSPFSLPLETGLQLLLACWAQPGAAFGPWSHLSLPWDWLLGPSWRPRQDILFAGVLKAQLLPFSLSWNFFCRVSSTWACSRCPLAPAPSLRGASSRSRWSAWQGRRGLVRSSCTLTSWAETPGTIPSAFPLP